MIEIPRTHKKLREAKFFLTAMTASQGPGHRFPEHFDFYFSAFLSAARSVTFTFQKENKTAYDEHFPRWESSLTVEQRSSLKFMVAERNRIEKEGEASKDTVIDMIELREYSPTPPHVIPALDTDGTPINAALFRHIYKQDGAETSVTSICTNYLELLSTFVAQVFER